MGLAPGDAALRLAPLAAGVVIAFAFGSAIWAPGERGLSTVVGPQERVIVIWVAPNGPAWDVGIRPGDTLARQPMAGDETTTPLVVETGPRRVILRPHDLIPTPLDLLYPALGLCLLALGAHVRARGRDRVAARRFWRMGLCGALALGAVPAGIHGLPWALVLEFVALRLFGPALIDLAAVLPSSAVISPLRLRPWRLLLWVPALALVLVYPLVWWRPGRLLPLLTVTDDVLLTAYLAAACLHVLIILRQPLSTQQRAQLRLLAVGLIGGFAPLLLATLLPLILFRHTLLPAQVSSLAVLILFLCVATAIVRTEFLGITALIHRRPLHALLCGALAATIVAATAGVLAGTSGWGWPPEVAMSVGALMAFGAFLMLPRLMQRVERLLLPDAYDPADVTLRVSAALAQAPPQALGPLAVAHLVTIFNLEFALLLTDRDRDPHLHLHTRNFVPATALEGITSHAYALLGISSVMQPLMEVVVSIPVLLVPIGDGQRVRAVLCCGPKHSGDCYTRQDRALVHAFGHYLAARFDFQTQLDARGALLAVPREAVALVPVQLDPASLPNVPVAASLTRRELLVLRLLAQGLGNKEIAERLEREPDTIEKHVKNIRRKLGVRAITEAVALARQRGLLPPE